MKKQVVANLQTRSDHPGVDPDFWKGGTARYIIIVDVGVAGICTINSVQSTQACETCQY